MILLLAVILPVLAALAIVVTGGRKAPPALGRNGLLVGAVSHLLLCMLTLRLDRCWSTLTIHGLDWLALDRFSGTILLLTSALFLWVAIHCRFWLKAEKQLLEINQAEPGASAHGRLLPEWIFLPCLLAFLAAMTLAICASNLGLMWVAIEATTLVSAPLICFHRSAAALEAMWKYLLICSVGIGLALFGTMLVAHGIQLGTGEAEIGLNFSAFARAATAGKVNLGWFKAGFIFILAGYGTKMELAPFHTWLPDSYSEAPSPVSALLSGMLASCAFLAVLRFFAVTPDQLREFGQVLLIALGLVSLATAAFFIVRQNDYKRMLAYSSVEHMGLAAIMLALGGVELAVLHCVGHALIKTMLSLLSGNIQLGCGVRTIRDIGGLLERMPRNAILWLAGLFLISGTPPSPLFVTEFVLVRRAGPVLGGIILLLLFVIFAGMSQAMVKMCMGTGDRKPYPLAAVTGEKLWPIPLLVGLAALTVGAILTYMLDGTIKIML